MFTKKARYSELWFCDEYYVAGVNILAESKNRIFVKKIDFDIGFGSKDFPYKYIKEATLYKFVMNKKSFRFALTQPEPGIYLIAFLTDRDFTISAAVNDDESRSKNKKLIYNFAITHYVDQHTTKEYRYFYSDTKEKRAKVKLSDGHIRIYYEKFYLNPDAEIDFPDNLKENPYQFLGGYEDDGTVSYYTDMEEAMKNISQYLSE